MPWEGRDREDGQGQSQTAACGHAHGAGSVQLQSLSSAALSSCPTHCPSLLLTSSDTRLSMAPSMECSAPGEAEDMVSGLVWGCSPGCLHLCRW